MKKAFKVIAAAIATVILVSTVSAVSVQAAPWSRECTYDCPQDGGGSSDTTNPSPSNGQGGGCIGATRECLQP
jgi:hypothetical protein